MREKRRCTDLGGVRVVWAAALGPIDGGQHLGDDAPDVVLRALRAVAVQRCTRPHTRECRVACARLVWHAVCREWLVSTSFDGTAGLVPHDEEETGLEVRHGVVDAPQRRSVHHIARHPAPTQISMVLSSGACAVMGLT